MIAYHGDPKVKWDLLDQLTAHAKADEIVRGYGYWQDGKGCAVGCTIHSANHKEYETKLGIPQVIARLEDLIFEGLPSVRARVWPIQFAAAIRPGADLSRVVWHFLHWILTDSSVNPGIDHPLVRDVVKRCADLLVPLTQGQSANLGEALPVHRAACAVGNASHAAPWAAVCASDAAISVAWSVNTHMAECSVESVESAATAVKSAMLSMTSPMAAYVKMADKLLDLLMAEKPGDAK